MNFNLQLNYEGFEEYYITHGPKLDGIQYIFRFENDYGASVVKFKSTFGYKSDLWELAVILGTKYVRKIKEKKKVKELKETDK